MSNRDVFRDVIQVVSPQDELDALPCVFWASCKREGSLEKASSFSFRDASSS